MKKICTILLAFSLLLVPFGSLAQGVAQPWLNQDTTTTTTNDTLSIIYAYTSPRENPSEMPELDGDGFIPEGQPAFAYKNHSEGYWLFIDQEVRVEITRNQTTSPTLTWYIADIQCQTGTYLHTISDSPSKPGKSNNMPEAIAKEHNAVYAQSGDFYTYRVSHDQTVGIVIRDSEIIHSKTYSKSVLGLPSLDNMVLFPNGTLEVNAPHTHTAKEYIEQGATDVIAFGPILIEDGTINPVVYTNFTYKEPRNAMGYVGPGHYVGILVEGRMDHSEGSDLKFMAETLYALGCTQAINLDGGGTSAMVFMGESVQLSNSGDPRSSTRAVPDILTVGTY